MSHIQQIQAREILDSRGNPTIEVDVRLSDRSFGRAAVPSGASTGSREAVELRDNDQKRFKGKGVLKAIQNVREKIAPALAGADAAQQSEVDAKLCELDGTDNKSNLGANAILGVSLAVARAQAASSDTSLFRYLGGAEARTLPLPMFNVLNGGVHSDSRVDLQEFMIAPVGALSFREAVQHASETYQALKSLLKSKGYRTAVGDEGGFAPDLKANVEAIELILQAIQEAGFTPGRDIVLALDPAASEFFRDGKYVFNKSDQSQKTSDQMIEFYEDWVRQFPIWSIEDGLAEQDWSGWKRLTERLGKQIQLVGDDIFVTNPKIIQEAITQKIANASLIKLNQIGTLSETFDAVNLSRSAGYGIVVSHRSGETADDFIADFAVGCGAPQIKTGAPCRGERVAKYNQLSRIEEELGSAAIFPGAKVFDQFLKPLRERGGK
jgi:enolase